MDQAEQLRNVIKLHNQNNQNNKNNKNSGTKTTTAKP